ncbi:MAG TPA: hypothetical protein VHZ78_06855 [Rhizomicrobium sp.]|jgi:hypothetical protein|nr:hypothetical protein [Rhizomicrobium sp.]
MTNVPHPQLVFVFNPQLVALAGAAFVASLVCMVLSARYYTGAGSAWRFYLAPGSVWTGWDKFSVTGRYWYAASWALLVVMLIAATSQIKSVGH